jgi:hypothetical protein
MYLSQWSTFRRPTREPGRQTSPSSAMVTFSFEVIAAYLPTRGAVELMWAAVGGFRVNPTSVVALGCWIVAMAALALWAYRRDEGRRFS